MNWTHTLNIVFSMVVVGDFQMFHCPWCCSLTSDNICVFTVTCQLCAMQDDQDGTRFWREEREEGAVYKAYLKRVTYLSQARVSNNSDR